MVPSDEVVGNTLIRMASWRNRPDSGDEGKTGQRLPFLGKIVVDEFFAGAFEAIGAFFECH